MGHAIEVQRAVRKPKLQAIAEQAILQRRKGIKYCARCDVRLRPGEFVTCDPCWALMLAERIAVGDTRWSVDLKMARERMKARGQGAADDGKA